MNDVLISERPVNKILLIDDEEDVLIELYEMMVSLGFTCVCANNTREALNALEENRDIVLIISDLRLPDQSGLRLLQILNEQDTSGPKIPIIITSGHADMDDVIGLFRHGAIDFLPKPIHYEHLVAQLKRVLPAHNFI